MKLQEATEAQLDALQVTPSNTKVSDYVLTLAHDVETLKVRSPLFNAIMYDKGGLSRAERELGAIAASMVNRCIYCAAVHAARHAQLTHDTAVTDYLFAEGTDARLSPRDRAIFDFAFASAWTAGEATPQKCSASRRGAGRVRGSRPHPVLGALRLGEPADARPRRSGPEGSWSDRNYEWVSPETFASKPDLQRSFPE